MNIVTEIRLARLCGKAIKCFNNGMYSKVVEYLEKACEIGLDERKSGLVHYYLGLSYIELKKKQKAFESLPIAYNGLYDRATEDNKFLKQFIYLTKAYVNFLAEEGEWQLANELIEKKDRLLFSKGYTLDHSRRTTKIKIVEDRESRSE